MPTPVNLKIKFKTASVDDFIEHYEVDGGSPGIVVRARQPVDPGTPIRFDFTLQEGDTLIQGEGHVAWIRDVDPTRPGGVRQSMSVRFDHLGGADADQLERILSERAARLYAGTTLDDGLLPSPEELATESWFLGSMDTQTKATLPVPPPVVEASFIPEALVEPAPPLPVHVPTPAAAPELAPPPAAAPADLDLADDGSGIPFIEWQELEASPVARPLNTGSMRVISTVAPRPAMIPQRPKTIPPKPKTIPPGGTTSPPGTTTNWPGRTTSSPGRTTIPPEPEPTWPTVAAPPAAGSYRRPLVAGGIALSVIAVVAVAGLVAWRAPGAGSARPDGGAEERAPALEAAPPVHVAEPRTQMGPLAKETLRALQAPLLDLVMDSDPAGAEVVLDGLPVGRTPVRLSTIASGLEHEAVFERKGFRAARVKFVDAPGTLLRPKLRELPHFILLTTSPAGAIVLLDNKKVGKTGAGPLVVPIHDLLRRHELRVGRRGFLDEARAVSLNDEFEERGDGRVLPIVLKLRPAVSVGPGYLAP